MEGSNETSWRILDSSVKVAGTVVQKNAIVNAGLGEGSTAMLSRGVTEKAGGSAYREVRWWENLVSPRQAGNAQARDQGDPKCCSTFGPQVARFHAGVQG